MTSTRIRGELGRRALLALLATGQLATPSSRATPAWSVVSAAQVRSSSVAPEDERARVLDLTARLDAYVGRVRAIGNVAIRIRTLTQLGALTCRWNQEYGGLLLSEAATVLSAAETEASAKTAKSSEILNLPAYRATLTTHVSVCNPGLLPRLPKPTEGMPVAGIDGRAALAMVDQDVHAAVETASQALSQGLLQQPLLLHELLLTLKKKDRAAADRLFLDAVNGYLQQPVVDINAYLTLGTYLFTASLSLPENRVIQKSLGGPVSTVLIPQNRPDLAPDLASAYVRAALAILLRPELDAKLAPFYYAAASQLAPKVAEFAPDQIGAILAVLQTQAARAVPGELAPPEAYQRLQREFGAPSMAPEEEFGALTKGAQRDAAIFTRLPSLLMTGDFARAKKIIALVSSEELRSSLFLETRFSESAKGISAGQSEQAAEIVKELPAGLHRAVLTLGLLAAKKGRRAAVHGDEVLLATQGLASWAVDDRTRGCLLMAASHAAASVDPQLALTLLSDAVTVLNRSAASPARFIAVDAQGFETPGPFVSKVTFGTVERGFPLDVSGVRSCDMAAIPGDFAPGRLATEAESLLLGLKDERLLAGGLVGFVANTMRTASSSEESKRSRP